MHASRLPEPGFTLSELLISLAIVGVISTFSISKLLITETSARYKAAAKEAIATLAGAYQSYKLNSSPTAATRLTDLFPFINYIKQDTATTIDATDHGYTCDASNPCIVLHSGAWIYAYNAPMGGADSSHFVWALIDPDGTGSAKGVWVCLFFNGRITDWGNLPSGSIDGDGNVWSADPTYTPDWFGWS